MDVHPVGPAPVDRIGGPKDRNQMEKGTWMVGILLSGRRLKGTCPDDELGTYDPIQDARLHSPPRTYPLPPVVMP